MSWPIPKLRGRFSRSGFCIDSQRETISGSAEGGRTYLGLLLGASLSLRERGGGRFLSGLWWLSLREDVSLYSSKLESSSLKRRWAGISAETQSSSHCHH